MKTIALANQKGGVGKTTTAASLGIGLSRQGKKVLLIDADAQGNLTQMLGWSQPDELSPTLSTLMEKVIAEKPIAPGEGILHHPSGVHLVPANIELSALEVTLVNTMSRETVLRQYLSTVADRYDYTLIDCMPSLGMLTINALTAADSVIIPVQAQYLPAKGLEQLLRTITRVKRQLNPKLEVDGILLTMLGTYTVKGKTKIVVACGDFTEPGITLQDFASLKNQIIDSERNGYGTELSDILHTFEEQEAIDREVITERFWDMFIVDALIGNWDRHNGNWGFLYDARTDMMTLAPVYDCGSCLYPQADDEIMKKVLSNESDLNYRIFEIPTSAIMLNGKKIKYFDFIVSLQNEDCNRALKRIVPRIDMVKIHRIIEDTPFITDLQKRFYTTMLDQRKERILDFSLIKLEKERAKLVHKRSVRQDRDER